MFSNILVPSVAIALSSLATVRAEQHTIHFTNNCGFGTPTLVAPGGGILSTGGDVTFSGEARGLIAYLQTGGCGLNGEGCLIVETSLINGASSTDLSLIPPHAFSVTTGFGYFAGCDGAGADCTNAGCPMVFRQPSDTFAQVACTASNGNLAITFCD